MDTFLFLIFFFYGLAFFGMGITLALESEREIALAEGRVLRPLALFALVHGSHEWLESYLLQAKAAGSLLPTWLDWAEIFLLAVSYLFLFSYGIRSFRSPGYQPLLGMFPSLLLLGVYGLAICVSAFLAYRQVPIPWEEFLEGMTRYLMAVPSAFLAALALRHKVRQASRQNQKKLARNLIWAAIGFGIYGLTHLFVKPLDMFPARYINVDTFRMATGVPIQVFRTVAAVVITLNLLWATRETGRERQRQFVEAQQARVEALERVQKELTEKETLRRELLRHIVQAQEDERARIARELHDETAQALAAFSLDLATMQTLVPDKPECQQLNTRLQSLSRQIAQGLYRLVHDLRPAQLDDLGLVPAIQYLVDHDSRTNGLNIHFSTEGKVRRLDNIIETVLFRVAQEALNNVIRHANTKRADISLSYGRQEVTLIVKDWGKGFDPGQKFVPPRGWGLAGMRERVEAVGGDLSISSRPGAGTEVKVTLHSFDLIP